MKALDAAARHRILVVDDDRNLRKIIATNLELDGFDVITAASGPEALRLLDGQRFDLVLLDIMMPQLDGYQTAAGIRTHPTNANVPIIMLTAKSQLEDKLRGFEAGADDYMIKPFGPQELLARVRAKIRRVESDASLSPLTRLPGNLAIEAELRLRIDAHAPFAMLYEDLDNFKAFNDVYGFACGDKAIKMLADITVGVVHRRGTPRDFVGHVGGDDFVVVTGADRGEEIAREVISEFDRDIRTLYSRRDLNQGFIETRDRRGLVRRFPIMSLSIAITSTEHRTFTDYAQIGEAAAELKRYAKSIGGSTYVKDKRKA